MTAKEALERALRDIADLQARVTRLEDGDGDFDFEVADDGRPPIEQLRDAQIAVNQATAARNEAERKSPYDEPLPEGFHDWTPEQQGQWKVEHEVHVETGDEAKARARAANRPVPQMVQNGDDVRFAKPNADQKALRAALIPQMGFEHWTKPMTDDSPAPPAQSEIPIAYQAGGPLWLYHYCRDFVMTLPPEVRAEMVRDVELGPDPETAEWLGRDILKREQGLGEGVAQKTEQIVREAG